MPLLVAVALAPQELIAPLGVNAGALALMPNCDTVASRPAGNAEPPPGGCPGNAPPGPPLPFVREPPFICWKRSSASAFWVRCIKDMPPTPPLPPLQVLKPLPPKPGAGG